MHVQTRLMAMTGTQRLPSSQPPFPCKAFSSFTLMVLVLYGQVTLQAELSASSTWRINERLLPASCLWGRYKVIGKYTSFFSILCKKRRKSCLGKSNNSYLTGPAYYAGLPRDLSGILAAQTRDSGVFDCRLRTVLTSLFAVPLTTHQRRHL